MKLCIKYKSSEGTISERKISVMNIIDENKIDAYCYLRNEERTFKLTNIISAVDPDSGELIDNIWEKLNLYLTIESQWYFYSKLSNIISAIKALKSFTYTIRNFSKRERNYILDFIIDNSSIAENLRDNLEKWLIKLPCSYPGSYCELTDTPYEKLLEEIPTNLLLKCHKTALLIAKGSGRKPIEEKVLDKIDNDFYV